MKKASLFFKILPIIIFTITVFLTESFDTFAVLLLSIMIHESAHFLVFLSVGGVGSFRCVTGGLSMDTGDGSMPYVYELALTAAGPLANLTCVILMLLVSKGQPGTAVWVNLSLAAANLLPIRTLDGGRIVSVICNLVFPFSVSKTVSDAISAVCAFSVAFLSLYIWFRTGKGEYFVFFSFLCVARHFANDKC
ncbi:MAG: site-2 protease family protein [Eubacteriales bacterium]|nr:site-2 protease family protein [Eubacteriales bacterium]